MSNREIKRGILVVGAQPDDEVIGVGGSMAWHTNICEDEVFVLILTDGCMTQYHGDEEIIPRKRNKALEANRILGVKEVIFEDLSDI